MPPKNCYSKSIIMSKQHQFQHVLTFFNIFFLAIKWTGFCDSTESLSLEPWRCHGFLFSNTHLTHSLLLHLLSLRLGLSFFVRQYLLTHPCKHPADSLRSLRGKLIPLGHSSSGQMLRRFETGTVYTVICQVSLRAPLRLDSAYLAWLRRR